MSETLSEFNPEEKTPEQIQEWGERFRESLLENGFLIVEMGERASIETILESIEDERLFSELSDQEKEKALQVFEKELGFKQAKEKDLLFKEYSMQGTPDSPGEGKIKVEVFRTNQEDVFLRRYTYANGDTSWSLGPEFLEDEEV